jgi:hypothetical protein
MQKNASRVEGNQHGQHIPVWFQPGDIMPGQYRHYKGGEYAVLFCATEESTEARVVVYQSLANPSQIWTRSCIIFDEYVEFEGKRQKRFEQI